jgi:mannose-6-phosphate isomerase-like protein (cupin superfamily)
MSETPAYSMHMNVLFEHLAKVDVPKLIRECEDPWWNQTLCQVNDCVVRLGIIKGEFHWHQHEEEDEFFFVLEGKLFVDVRDDGGERSVELDPHQGYTVTRGIVHRTRAPVRTAILMVEKASVDPTGS